MAINESKIASVVNALMEDYGKGRVIDEIKMFDYPDRAVIIDLLEKLKIIIYPGYHRNGNYRTSRLSPQRQLPHLHGQKQYFHSARGYYLQPDEADCCRSEIRAATPKP